MSRGIKLVAPALLLAALVELVVFILVGRLIGFGWALLLVLAASLLGVFVLQREGIRAWRGLRAVVDGNRPPGAPVIDGVAGLLAGLLLALPGFVSGTAGLLLLLPPVRVLARRRMQRFTERRVSSTVAGGLFGPRRIRVWPGQPQPSGDGPGPTGDGLTIDGEVVEPGRQAG